MGLDEFELHRIRRTNRRRRRRTEGAPAAVQVIGKVTSASGTIAVNRFVTVQAQGPFGPESEGKGGTLTNNGSTLLVLILGPKLPSTGDTIECRWVDYRWVSQSSTGGTKGPSGGITLPNCFCEVPASLTMTSYDESCNFRMFQSCTISYGPPKPSMVAVGLTAYGYSSDQMFLDPLTNTDFFYYFACQYNQFYLSRLYPVSSNGTVYHDGILYNWIVGGYGNSCTPFKLDYGQAFPGSDTTCRVTIEG